MAASRFVLLSSLCALALVAVTARAESTAGYDPFEAYDPFGDVQEPATPTPPPAP